MSKKAASSDAAAILLLATQRDEARAALVQMRDAAHAALSAEWCDCEPCKAKTVALRAALDAADAALAQAEEIPPGFVAHPVALSPDGQTLAFRGQFTTVRACRHCGVLVTGGPTACVACVRHLDAQPAPTAAPATAQAAAMAGVESASNAAAQYAAQQARRKFGPHICDNDDCDHGTGCPALPPEAPPQNACAECLGNCAGTCEAWLGGEDNHRKGVDCKTWRVTEPCPAHRKGK